MWVFWSIAITSAVTLVCSATGAAGLGTLRRTDGVGLGIPSGNLLAVLLERERQGLDVGHHELIADLDLLEVADVRRHRERHHLAFRALERDLALGGVDRLDGGGDLVLLRNRGVTR
jgi:hypothetical protein